MATTNAPITTSPPSSPQPHPRPRVPTVRIEEAIDTSRPLTTTTAATTTSNNNNATNASNTTNTITQRTKIRRRSLTNVSIKSIPLEDQYNDPSASNNKCSWLHRAVAFASKWLTKLPKPRWRDVVKVLIAYIITYILIFIKPVALAVGSFCSLMPIGILLVPPAKTLGGMNEAVLGGLFGLILGDIFAIISAPFYYWTQNSIMNAIFMFLWTGIFSWTKIAYPRLSAGSTCGFLVVLFTLTTDMTGYMDNLQVVYRVTIPLLISFLISWICCVCIFHKTANHVFRETLRGILAEINSETNCLKELFLLDPKEMPTHRTPPPTKVQGMLKKLFDVRHETLYEISYGRITPEQYRGIVKRVKVLGQHLGGMRSAVKAKVLLIKKGSPIQNGTIITSSRYDTKPITELENFKETPTIYPWRTSRSRTTTQQNASQVSIQNRSGNQIHSNDQLTEKNNLSVFNEFMKKFAKSLSSLEHSCGHVLEKLQGQVKSEPIQIFGKKMKTEDKGSSVDSKPEDLVILLQEALSTFDKDHWQTIQSFHNETESGINPDDPNVFLRDENMLVLFYAFSLREFCIELIELAKIVKLALEQTPEPKFWRARFHGFSKWTTPDALISRIKAFESDLDIRNSMDEVPMGQFNDNNVDNDDSKPQNNKTVEPWISSRKLRKRIRRLRSSFSTQEVKYGVKAAIAITILCAPAWLSSWSEWFHEIRGVWAAATCNIVFAPLVGNSLLFSFIRLIGTFVGALLAYLICLVPYQPVAYIVLLVIVAAPWVYLFLQTKHVRFGITALLTLPIIIAPTVYAMYTEDPIETVILLATKRFVATIVGIVFAIFVSSNLWTFSAQTELRISLGATIFHLGLLYSKLVSMLMTDTGVDEAKTDDNGRVYPDDKNMNANANTVITMDQLPTDLPTSPQHHYQPISPSKHLLSKMFSEIQGSIAITSAMINTAEFEPQFTTRFPKALYNTMNDTCQNILDLLHALQSAVEIGWGDEVMNDLIRPINPLRRELFAGLLLYFHILSSSLVAKENPLPLPPYMPNTKSARLRCIARLQELTKLKDLTRTQRQFLTSVYFFAYSLTMRELIREVEALTAYSKCLVGENYLVKTIFNDAS